LKPARTNSSRDSILKEPSQKRGGRVAQSVDHEFTKKKKTHTHTHTKKDSLYFRGILHIFFLSPCLHLIVISHGSVLSAKLLTFLLLALSPVLAQSLSMVNG
jgi:hypothetical protein